MKLPPERPHDSDEVPENPMGARAPVKLSRDRGWEPVKGHLQRFVVPLETIPLWLAILVGLLGIDHVIPGPQPWTVLSLQVVLVIAFVLWNPRKLHVGTNS